MIKLIDLTDKKYMTMDNYMTEQYNDHAPWNKTNYHCELCDWKGDNPQTEEITIEEKAIEINYCPTCQNRLS